MRVLLTFLSILAFVCTGGLAEIDDAKFKEWMLTHSIQLEDPDKVYPVWKKNAEFVQQHNSLGLSYQVSLNQFAHLTPKELVGKNTFQKDNCPKPHPQAMNSRLRGSLPPSLDWRTKGAVTPVFNQGECGSAGTYAIVDSVNSFGFIKNGHGKLEETSFREFTDCCTNGSCTGSTFNVSSYACIASFGGMACSYPVGTNNTCESDKVKPCVVVKGGKQVIPYGDENALAEALLEQPIAVGIDASHSSFQLYEAGVIYEPGCSSTTLDHAVLLVGYGTEKGEDYWLIKNSWGPDWGMKGYAMMARNKNNNCGIATCALYPY